MKKRKVERKKMPILRKDYDEIDVAGSSKTVDYFLMYDLDYDANEQKFPDDEEVYVTNVFIFGYHHPEGDEKPEYYIVDVSDEYLQSLYTLKAIFKYEVDEPVCPEEDGVPTFRDILDFEFNNADEMKYMQDQWNLFRQKEYVEDEEYKDEDSEDDEDDEDDETADEDDSEDDEEDDDSEDEDGSDEEDEEDSDESDDESESDSEDEDEDESDEDR